MIHQIEYSGRQIELFYSDGDINYKKYKFVSTGVGKGKLKNFDKVMEESLSYLVKNAASKCNRNLQKIINITRNFNYDKKRLSVTVIGIPVFEKD